MGTHLQKQPTMPGVENNGPTLPKINERITLLHPYEGYSNEERDNEGNNYKNIRRAPRRRSSERPWKRWSDNLPRD